MTCYCQDKVLYLKNKEVIKFQTWDTLYASVRKNNVIITDSKGNRYTLKLSNDKDGNEANIMLTETHYHIHGSWKTYPCHEGSIIMDDKMKLYFEEKSVAFSWFSSFADHGSHYSHKSHYSSKL